MTYTALVAGWWVHGLPNPSAFAAGAPAGIPHVTLSGGGLALLPDEADELAARLIEAAKVARGATSL